MYKVPISVVIPCFNEEEVIELTVERVSKVLSNELETFEIIVVDDGSSDNTSIVLDNISKKFDISRAEQDQYAFNSQKKTELAIINNKFEDEIIKINLKNGILEKDEHPRVGLKISDLQKLKTVFKQ